MKTEDLLRYTYRVNCDSQVPYTKEELKDRRRLLRRILAGSRFYNCSDSQLDNLTAYQLPNGKYVINDWDGYEWQIDGFQKLDGSEIFG